MLLLQRQSNDEIATSTVLSSSLSPSFVAATPSSTSLDTALVAPAEANLTASTATTTSYSGPQGYIQARAEAAAIAIEQRQNNELLLRMVDNRPYFPLYIVDPKNKISVINIVNSILLLATSSCTQCSTDVCDCHNDKNKAGNVIILNENNVTISPITGGLTNALYKVDYPSVAHNHPQQQQQQLDNRDKSSNTAGAATTTIMTSSVLVRIFGADGIINRDIETNTFAQLCSTTTCGAGKLVHPHLDILGRFANGRIETYIPNMRPATVSDLVGEVDGGKSTSAFATTTKNKEEDDDDEEKDGQQSPQLLLGLEVARQMARLHYGITPSSSSSYTEQPTLWKVIKSWIYDLATNISNEKVKPQHRKVFHNVVTNRVDCWISYRNDLVSYLYNEVTWLQQYVETRFSTTTTTCPVTFCHNDINFGNILLRDESADSPATPTTTASAIEYNQETVCIIDYEYCDTNYSMYDVANYFCEYAGGNDNGIPNYDLLPCANYQMSFLHEYIRTRNEFTSTPTHDGGMSCGDNNDEDEEVAQLLEQVEIFQMASCLLWGVWGILQSTSQIIDGDTFTFDENVQSRLSGETDVDIFDYLRYGKNRLARYRYLKQQKTRID